MSLSPQQVETFRRDGVLPLGRVLEMPVVEEARAHLEALRTKNKMDDATAGSGTKFYRLLNTSSTDPWFDCIVKHPNVLDAAEAILGPNIQYYQDNVFYKPAKDGSATAWHQDNIWWNSSPPDMLTVWIALDDTDHTNGAVQYIAGSHSHLIDPELPVNDPNGMKYKVLAPEQVDQSKAIEFVVPAGHAVMHHCLTIHGGPPNNSDRVRRGYTVHLGRTGVFPIEPGKNQVILRGNGSLS
jgi:ectoine hydroxylase-related dioxygenase (phytanoyl-CoA dioxygenase family)